MPLVPDKELAELIRTEQVLLLSIDTSIFDQKQHSYHNEPLRSLTQFADSRYGFILSSTVVSEITSHYAAKTKSAVSNLEKAVKEVIGSFDLRDRTTGEMVKSLLGEPDVDAFAKDRVSTFLGDCGATVVDDAATVPVAEMIERYFSSQPPFSIKKKSEFPDAIALLAIEKYAQSTRLKCVVVSTDLDWKEFCTDSDELFYHNDLVQVLSWLARPDTGFKKFWESAPDNEDAQAMRDELLDFAKDAVLEIEVSVDATPNFSGRVEAEHWGTRVDVLDFVPEDTALVINDLERDEVFVASFRVSAEVSLDVTLDHIIWDSADKEEIHLNSSEETVEQDVDFRMEATIRKNGDSFEVVRVSVPPLWTYIHFDSVDVF